MKYDYYILSHIIITIISGTVYHAFNIIDPAPHIDDEFYVSNRIKMIFSLILFLLLIVPRYVVTIFVTLCMD